MTLLARSSDGINKDTGSSISEKTKHKQFQDFNSQTEISINERMSYDSIFMTVKKVVKSVTGQERAGLGLALSNLPSGLGAFWQVGGNYIVMNELMIDAMEKIAKDNFEFNSFVFISHRIHRSNLLNEGIHG